VLTIGRKSIVIRVSLQDTLLQARSMSGQVSATILQGSLKGKKVIIRDLQALIDDWPEGINSDVARLRKDLDYHLNR